MHLFRCFLHLVDINIYITLLVSNDLSPNLSLYFSLSLSLSFTPIFLCLESDPGHNTSHLNLSPLFHLRDQICVCV